MSDIGNDIKEVFAELAEAVSIYDHASGEVISSDEFLDFNRDWLSRSAFESEFIITCTFAYDTQAKPGDRVDFHTEDGRYLVATLVSNVFEREVISKDGILYKCNKQAMLERISGETRNDEYELVNNWEEIFSGEYILYTGRVSDQDIVSTDQSSRFYTSTRRVFASHDLDIKSKDRLRVGSAVFQIEKVEPDRLPGINICTLIDFQGEL